MTSRSLSLKAGPTWYHGTRFRSRAEARWAVLFDKFDIQWNYQHEGYQLASGCYLPDFWLRQWQCFAEVKGGVDQWNAEAIMKAESLAKESRRPLLLLDEFNNENWCVPVLTADTDGQVLKLDCDILHSVERERCWYDDLGSSIFKYRAQKKRLAEWQMVAQLQWSLACDKARNTRFERGCSGG
jgi:hypothetical protein